MFACLFLCHRGEIRNTTMTELVTIQEIDKRKGRGVIVNIDLGPNEHILSVRPDITALYSAHANHFCRKCSNNCAADGVSTIVPDTDPVLRSAGSCPNCKQFALCLKCSCPADWEAHQVPCAWFCSLPLDVQRGDSDYLRFLLEYASRVQAGDTRLLLAMETLCTNEDSQSNEVKQFCESYSKLIAGHFGPRGIVIDQQHLYRLLLRTKSNSIGFPFTEAETIGWSLQEEVCMINHSCSPNCALRQTPAGEIDLRTLRAVKEGEELLISYVDLEKFSDVQSRTRHLLEQYRFLCQCEHCMEQRKH